MTEPAMAASSSDPALREQLCLRFGLEQDPFSEPGLTFFTGAQRGHHLETLRHLTSFGDLALVVAGAPGAGKTRLLAELCRLERDHLDFRVLDARQLTRAEGLAHALMQLYPRRRPPVGAPDTIIATFFRESEAATRRGRRMVLLLDDVDTVPEAVLSALLAGFAGADRALAAVPLLTAATPLPPALIQPQALVHPVELAPLGPGDIRSYLQEVFAAAGGNVDPFLDAERLEQLVERSQGSLGRLRRAAPAILLGLGATSTRGRQRHVLSASWRWLAVAGLLLGLSFLVVHWEYHGPGAVADQAPPAAAPVRQTIHYDLNLPEAPPESSTVTAPASPLSEVTGPASDGPGQARPGATPADAPQVDGTSDTSASGVEPAPAVERPLSEVQGVPAVSSGSEGGSGAEPLPENPVVGAQTDSGVEPAVIPEPERSGPAPQPGQDNGESAADKAPSAATGGPVEPAPLAKPKVSPEQDKPVTPTPAKSPEKVTGYAPLSPRHYRDRGDIVRSDGFVIQLSGSYSERLALDFVRRFPSLSLYYTRSTYHGKPWFVVLAGPYPGADAARDALAEFPERLQKGGPWIRRASGL